MNNIWESILDLAEQEIKDGFFRNLFTASEYTHNQESSTITVYMDSSVALFQKLAQDKYLPIIEKIFTETLAVDFATIKIEVKNDLITTKAKTRAKKAPVAKKINDLDLITKEVKSSTPTRSLTNTQKEKFTPGPLSKRLTFESFVVGDSNRLGYECAKSTAAQPSQVVNPLFIYGPPGLGKTHLARAAQNSMQKMHRQSRIDYCSAEAFVNRYVDAMKKNNLHEFRAHHRNLDILIVEDVQFLPKSKSDDSSIQKEFFHTFNELYENGKQIILTSDRPPKELSNLENRLVTRFAQGHTVEIQAPDFETRLAILEEKSRHFKVQIEQNILKLIAENIRSNVRELEGALTSLASSAGFKKMTHISDEEFVRQHIGNRFEEAASINMTSDSIIRSVSNHWDVSVKDIMGKRRTKNIAMPRQIAMYLSREMTGESLADIGERFNRTHSNILHACRSIQEKCSTDEHFSKTIEQMQDKLRKS